MQVKQDRVVSLDYVMKDGDGETLEDTHAGGPALFLLGGGQLMPAIETALTGKETGAEVVLSLKPEDAFGERRDDLVESIERSHFSKDVEFTAGSELEVAGPDGFPELIRIQAVTDTHVTLDRNHPLAGKEIAFSMTIRDVREATEVELEHGHPMADEGCCGGGCH